MIDNFRPLTMEYPLTEADFVVVHYVNVRCEPWAGSYQRHPLPHGR